MKTIIKLAIAAVILNAVVRVGLASWSYFQLKDAAQQTIIFGVDASPAQMHEEIMSKAEELGVPLDATDMEVRREGRLTTAEGAYVHPVEVFPSYEYPFEFSFSVEARAIR